MAKPTNTPAAPRAGTGERTAAPARRNDARPAVAVRARPGTGPAVTTPLAAKAGAPWQPPRSTRPPWNGALAAAEPGDRRRRPLTPSARRMYARRRRTLLLVFLLVVVVAVGIGQLVGSGRRPGPTALVPAVRTPAPASGSPSASASPTSRAGQRTGGPSSAPATEATGGDNTARAPGDTRVVGTFDYARGTGPLLGTGGSLRRFRVAVENGQGEQTVDFADAVNRILGDPRSWTAGGQLSMQRVARGRAAEFTIYLASAATSERMCATGGLDTARYTSCRLRGQVIINLDRWRSAVPDYGAPLDTYQAYAVNHEVGHQLGHGHEACPGAGHPAPVMQQQTYGLKGCTANAWPYLDGDRYVGEPVR